MPVLSASVASDGAASAPPILAADSDDRGTLLSVQILRFLAAFGVAVYHAHLHLAAVQPGYRSGIEDRIFQVGASGVHVFFVISGFVMVFTSFRGGRSLSPRQFLERRFFRIYPIYWLFAAVYVVTHWALGSPYALSSSDYVGAILLLPTFAAMIIGSGWTLTYEVYFYLAFGVALALGRRTGLALLTAFFASSAVAGAVFHLQGPVLSILTNALLLEFLAGCALGLIYRRVAVPILLGYIMLIVGGGGLVASEMFAPEWFPLTLALAPFSALLVAGALTLERQISAPVTHLLARLGDSSYTLYLLHILVIDLLLEISPVAAFGRHSNASALLAVPFAVAATALAVVGHRVVELPLLRWFRRAVLKTAPITTLN
ncbi:acyltransferase [Sphingomonas panacisoli]|uniref:Acyltransferase n=1 Tax=Sphingomonas panacisoli TaxID=1813879 RepID=A0A5B8LH12_9SPHN|nr:acyltransferase [Sphingomonas panacisoli]QDZ07638.1 acyltransferase [Sphingomonas panacisoli]